MSAHVQKVRVCHPLTQHYQLCGFRKVNINLDLSAGDRQRDEQGVVQKVENRSFSRILPRKDTDFKMCLCVGESTIAGYLCTLPCRGAVRLSSTLGSGHTALQLVVSELSYTRQKHKDLLKAQTAGNDCFDIAPNSECIDHRPARTTKPLMFLCVIECLYAAKYIPIATVHTLKKILWIS